MAYEWKISRLEKKKENGVVKQAIIGINCTNTINGNSGYIDWSVATEDIPCDGIKPTKAELKTYIKNYLKEDISDAQDGSITRSIQLKAQADRKIITHEIDDIIPDVEKTLTGL